MKLAKLPTRTASLLLVLGALTFATCWTILNRRIPPEINLHLKVDLKRGETSEELIILVANAGSIDVELQSPSIELFPGQFILSNVSTGMQVPIELREMAIIRTGFVLMQPMRLSPGQRLEFKIAATQLVDGWTSGDIYVPGEPLQLWKERARGWSGFFTCRLPVRVGDGVFEVESGPVSFKIENELVVLW